MTQYYKYVHDFETGEASFIFRKRETEDELYIERLTNDGRWEDDFDYLYGLLLNGDVSVEEIPQSEALASVKAYLK